MTAQDPGSTDKDLRIRDVKAYATSYPIPPGQSVTLGIGRAVKRDAVVVKVMTEGGPSAMASRTTAAPTRRSRSSSTPHCASSSLA